MMIKVQNLLFTPMIRTMRNRCAMIVVMTFTALYPTGLASARGGSAISVLLASDNTFVVTLDHAFHLRYGCRYPMTYQFGLPSGGTVLKVERKYAANDTWQVLPERASGDLFEAIDAVRFDSQINRAYVSTAFSTSSDTLFLRVSDSLANPVAAHFDGICKYYDNRAAAVTVSADDWSDWVVLDGRFKTLMGIFRSYHLYVTIGIITGTGSSSHGSWLQMQQQVDSGYVEVASHSRTHPEVPYANPVGEVVGSSQDIKNLLFLPPLFSIESTNYVYTWIAPYGEHDAVIDSLAGVAGYIAERLYANMDTTGPREYVYGDSTLSTWDENLQHFQPFLPTVELGAPSWGGGDTSLTSLNSLFDTIVAKGDVYHCMWHPQVIYPDRDMSYLRGHLQYISNRSNIWYVNLGHLYLYTLMRESVNSAVASVSPEATHPGGYELAQNYPNPFNPTTTIRYGLGQRSHVVLAVYDALGQKVAELVNGVMDAGYREVQFDGRNLASGVYFYRLQAGDFVQTRKLILVR